MDFLLFILQRSGHPETIGTFGYCKENAIIVSCLEEVEEAIQAIEKWEGNKVAVIAQTTFSMEKFDEIEIEIQKQLPKGISLEINKTICDATKLRQTETKEIAKNADCMIIIGGTQSSNTQKLYEISKQYCKKAYFVQTAKELSLVEIKQNEKIGIMAGASTPAELIEEVRMALK